MEEQQDEEYGKYRALYIEDVSAGRFPWRSAYYYYLQTTDRIDVMGMQEFQMEMSTLEQTSKGAVGKKMYELLDEHFSILELLSKNNQVVKLL